MEVFPKYHLLISWNLLTFRQETEKLLLSEVPILVSLTCAIYTNTYYMLHIINIFNIIIKIINYYLYIIV